MRERELDEFQSIFKRSIIPTIEVEKIKLDKILVLTPEGGAPDCRALADGFGVEVSERAIVHADDFAAILADEHPSMIIAPDLGELIDSLLVATPLPTLIARGADGPDLFRRILVNIPGGQHDLIEQFSFAFRLCPPGGTIRLLHVVDQERLARLAEILEVTPEVDTGASADLLAAVKARMDHLLRGAIRTARDAEFAVESAIEVGDPFEIVPRHARGFELLIVGAQSEHSGFLESRAYALMQRVPDRSVLAL
ncbi:MAG: hypothetical protein ACYTGN_04130 [Planctomycetota bacterium]